MDLLGLLSVNDCLNVAVVRNKHGLDPFEVLNLWALLIHHKRLLLELLFACFVLLHLSLQIVLNFREIPIGLLQ